MDELCRKLFTPTVHSRLIIGRLETPQINLEVKFANLDNAKINKLAETTRKRQFTIDKQGLNWVQVFSSKFVNKLIDNDSHPKVQMSKYIFLKFTQIK